ncbi:MAG: NADH-quinone oxidoreductase subunit N [Bacteroidales bacterium]|jgi:NADH-quinone oxidoreductase subunit N|nr:NADH-quinone oxidoreductase subunit N [Bacteroidales bacterium]
MDYQQFLAMRDELSLVIITVVLFIADMFASPDAHKDGSAPKLNTAFPVILMALHTVINLFPRPATEAFGGMYQYVPMMTAVKSILNIGTLIVFLMAHKWLSRGDTAFKQGEFYLLTFSTLLGMYFMISAGHFLMFFIGLETASIPVSALVAFNKYRQHSAEAGAKYILSTLFSSGLLLYGISLIYGTAGTLYFSELPDMLSGTPLQIMAFVFFLAGMGFKISLVPFHLWTADVYQGAPTVVTGYLSVVSKGSASFVLTTMLIKVFAPMITYWQEALYLLIIASITVANLFAIRQKNIKRFMAFSAISQAGYIMLGIIGGDAPGLTALVYYLLVYVASTMAVFMVIAVVEQQCDKLNIADYAGFGKTNPKLALLMMLALFSLAGIPPFAGFFSKFFIFMAAFHAGFRILVFIALLNTVISLYYYLLIVKAMYLSQETPQTQYFRSDNYSRAGMLLCLAGIICFGLSDFFYELIAGM